MSVLFRRSSQGKYKWLQSQAYRGYFTGTRYAGFVNYFHNENLFGFVVREDAPEREYYFHVTDIHAENIPRVRPLQPVEFSIIEGRGGNFLARDISSLGGQPVRYSHANMKMKEDERNRRLSELPNSEMERHTGVVVSVMPSGKGGLIIPDRLNFGAVGYSSNEIQCTGGQRLDRFAEVEFYARPSKFDRRDRAQCLTRRGGGLITAERRETGHSRRLLGAMYRPTDINATIPKDFETNRRKGYVISYNREKLFGFIMPFDGKQEQVFVHIDDCHVYGSRFLKRFQEVEFSEVTNANDGKIKALHVSGPNGTVLRPISENRYLTPNMTNDKLEIGENIRHRGTVMVADNKVNWFLIKPDQRGAEPVIAYKNHIHALGSKRVKLDDCVEFSVREGEANPERDNQLLRGEEITAPGGAPILCESMGALSKYLQTKTHLTTFQSELPQFDISDDAPGTVHSGFVSNYSVMRGQGRLEIEAKDANTRYRQVNFKLSDAQLPSGVFELDNYLVRDGNAVQFELKDIEDGDDFGARPIFHNPNETETQEQPEQRENIFLLKAVSIRSEGLDYLELMEKKQSSFVSQNERDDSVESSGFTTSSRERRNTTREDKQDLNFVDDDDEPLFRDDELEELEKFK